MGIWDYVIIALIVLAVIFALLHMARRKKQGRCVGCSGDCSQCVHAVGDNRKE